MSVVRYAWTATGLRPSEHENGAVRYVRETDFDVQVARIAELEKGLTQIAYSDFSGDTARRKARALLVKGTA